MWGAQCLLEVMMMYVAVEPTLYIFFEISIADNLIG